MNWCNGSPARKGSLTVVHSTCAGYITNLNDGVRGKYIGAVGLRRRALFPAQVESNIVVDNILIVLQPLTAIGL